MAVAEKVWQEFYCYECPADPKDKEKKTGGYFRVKLNMALEMNVIVVCPNCGHEHNRSIRNGEIHESRLSNAYEEKLRVPKSAWSRDPISKLMDKLKNKNTHDAGRRKGAVLKDGEDLVPDAEKIRSSIMRERWLELYGGNHD